MRLSRAAFTENCFKSVVSANRMSAKICLFELQERGISESDVSKNLLICGDPPVIQREHARLQEYKYGKLEGSLNIGGITLNINLDPRPRAVEIPTIPRRDETLIIQDSGRAQLQRELSQGTAPAEEAIHKPLEEPESEERRRANYLQARRDVARADERDRPPLPAWARR